MLVVDDRSKRRAQTHGRDRQPHKSNPFGFPVHVDPDLTPPPQEPPSPSDVDGSDTIAPPVRAVLEQHTEQFAKLSGWLEKLAPLRDGNRFDRIEATLAAIAAVSNRHQSMLDDMLVPQLDRWRATTDEIHGQVPRLIASIEQITILVGNIEQRIRAVEITVAMMVKRVDDDSKDYEKWFASAEKDREHLRSRIAAESNRITALEQVERDRVVEQQAIAKIARKKSRNAGALVGGGAAGLVAIAERIYHHFF
jgi:hypothetical protein